MFAIALWVGLMVFLAWKGLRHVSSSLEGEALLDGERYRYGADRTKNGDITATRVAFAVPRHLRFDVRPEGLFDRLAKALGITREWEVGDAAIDDHLYVDDEGAFAEIVAQRADVRVALRGLLTRLRANAARLRWLECKDGFLVLQVHTGLGGRHATVRDEAVRYLMPLVEALRGIERPVAPDGPRAEQRARLPLAIILGALVIGVGGGMLLHGFMPQRLVDPWSLWPPAWMGGSVMLALIVVWGLWRIGATPRRHRLLLQWLLFGMPACLAFTAFTTRIVDVVADRSAPTFIEARDARVYSSYRRRVGRQYYLQVSQHDDRVPGSLRIDAATYQRLVAVWGGTEGEKVTFAWRPGALGLPWVEVWN